MTQPDPTERVERLSASPVPAAVDSRRDWVLIALPTAIVLRLDNPNAHVLALAVLVSVAIVRRPEGRFKIRSGPLVCFFGACLLVFIRPDDLITATAVLLVGTLVLQLIVTVEARKLIASLVDGFGVLMLINFVGHFVGLTSPSQKLTSQEADRILFPLSGSVNFLPNAAAACLVAALFLLRDTDRKRLRYFRIAYSAAAFYILFGSGSRTALAVAVVLSAAAILTPSISRWIGQFATIFSSVSALTFPPLMESVGSAVTPLATLNPNRASDEAGVLTFQGRAEIWGNSIDYWNAHVTDPGAWAFGFGQLGQYRSGVSSSYLNIVYNLVDPHPEYANVHNSFLQQFYDGGVFGWLLLVAGIFWAISRLSIRRPQWGYLACAATFAMSAILLGATTEAFMAPGQCGESFWFIFVLVGISCQVPSHRVASLHDGAPRQRSPLSTTG